MRTGEMQRAISRYKYEGKIGWRAIFGRILVGYLNEHSDEFEGYDAITPSPTYMGEDAERDFDHTRMIVEAAEVEEPIAWPFEYDLVVKEARAMFRHPRCRQAVEGAQGNRRRGPPCRTASSRSTRVTGRKVLVFDDVFTEGFTIREVAKALVDQGASEVSEIVLARQPFRGG